MSEENKKAELPAHRDKRFDGVRDTWYWKLSKPVRVVVHFVIRTRNAYIHYGGFKGMYRRWKQKKGEASKRLDFGTKSFPNAEERRREEETVFPREIKISVLVPLYLSLIHIFMCFWPLIVTIRCFPISSLMIWSMRSVWPMPRLQSLCISILMENMRECIC